jgi:hypothetical protein
MSLSPTPTWNYLESLFPGQALVPVIKAGCCLSYAQQTTRNKLASGEFPLKTSLLGGKRVVRKSDLAAYIDDLGAKKRGRPKKSPKATCASDTNLHINPKAGKAKA